MPTRPPPDPGAAPSLVQTLRGVRVTCRRLQYERDEARRRIKSLEGEVVRYRHERDARTNLIAERDAKIELETDRAA